jgi:aryl-alcohol dehydrogenase-like predicted oxidoreductase
MGLIDRLLGKPTPSDFAAILLKALRKKGRPVPGDGGRQAQPRGVDGGLRVDRRQPGQHRQRRQLRRVAASHPEVARIADRHGRTVAQVIFRFALEVGMVALTGTTDAEHMKEDLAVFEFRLEPGEVTIIEGLVG